MFYIGKKHTMDVLIVICVGSVRKVPVVRFPRREAHRGRIDGYLLGVRTEGTGTAFYFDEKHPLNVFDVICVACARKGHSMVFDLNKKHTMYVLIVVCVGSVRKAHILRFTSARSTP